MKFEMGLKQNITIMNKFTQRTAPHKGTEGGSPGEYVYRYMGRDDAVESVDPIRQHSMDDFILRYNARASAVDKALTLPDAKKKATSVTGKGGIAFGYGSLSLSDEDLRKACRDTGELFEKDHTVLKTVFSFEEEYLRKHKVIPEDFYCEKKGDYYGNVDQLRLRMAIDRGMQKLAHDYDDLRYIAVIQVDTEHVHCHLTMVDAGEGRLANNGRQRGMLSDKQKSVIRRGIDSYLDEKQHMRFISSSVEYERQNVQSYVKRWAYEQVLEGSTPQFLLACLPEDKRLWRAGSNAKEMTRANAMARGLVEDVLARPDSPMPEAMVEVQKYANERQRNESLTADEWAKLVDDGRKRIVDGCVNGVYGMLQSIPENEAFVKTPMIDVMSLDMEELRSAYAKSQFSEDKDDLVEFSFRLRSYGSRMENHRKKRVEAHDQMKSYERAKRAGVVATGSEAVRDFYAFEEDYHAKLASKYQHFLPFTQTDEILAQEWQEAEEYGRVLMSMRMLAKDRNLSRMKDADEAERRGEEIYGVGGGRYLTMGELGRRLTEERIQRVATRYDEMVDDFKIKVSQRGFVVQCEGSMDLARRADESVQPDTAAPKMSKLDEEEFDFNEVRALDMHELMYDFSEDVEVGEDNVQIFVNTAKRRRELLIAARAYLESTDQHAAAANLPTAEVEQMHTLSGQMQRTGKLPSRLAAVAAQQRRNAATRRRARTVALSSDLVQDVRQVVSTTVEREVGDLRAGVEREM